MKAIRELRSRLARLGSSGPSRDQTEGILIRVRKVLEERPYRAEFLHLHFMCHWIVHSSLSDSPLIYRWLTTTSDAAFALFSGTSSFAELTKTGATVLDLDGLRAQLRGLLVREQLPSLVTDQDHFWYFFVQGLLECIYENPIGVPKAGHGNKRANERAQAYLAKYTATPEKPWLNCIREIEVFVKDKKFKVATHSQGRLNWVFTIATMYPFMEFDAFGLPDSPWAETTDVVMRPSLAPVQ